jgi:hypothetical protein
MAVKKTTKKLRAKRAKATTVTEGDDKENAPLPRGSTRLRREAANNDDIDDNDSSGDTSGETAAAAAAVRLAAARTSVDALAAQQRATLRVSLDKERRNEERRVAAYTNAKGATEARSLEATFEGDRARAAAVIGTLAKEQELTLALRMDTLGLLADNSAKAAWEARTPRQSRTLNATTAAATAAGIDSDAPDDVAVPDFFAAAATLDAALATGDAHAHARFFDEHKRATALTF